MAREEDRELLVAWEVEFIHKAGVIAQAGARTDPFSITRPLAGDSQFLWPPAAP